MPSGQGRVNMEGRWALDRKTLSASDNFVEAKLGWFQRKMCKYACCATLSAKQTLATDSALSFEQTCSRRSQQWPTSSIEVLMSSV